MSSRPMPPAGPVPVATMLTVREREGVDAAGAGSYRALHRDSFAELFHDLKSARASAVLLSVARCEHGAHSAVAELVREFPDVPTVAVMSSYDSDALQSVLSLGATGVRQIVDIRGPTGWQDLRTYLINSRTDELQRRILSQLAIDLASATPDCRRFFQELFVCPHNVRTVRMFAARLEVLPNTLMSRFFRARLPAPKQYLATARLVRCARLFESRGFSVSNVADHLDYSSPQSFGRHVRIHMQMTGGEFRKRFDGEGMFEHFRERLVVPYLDRLKRLRPLTPSLGATYAATLRR
jgi:AraC-like DNA-binding protein